MSSRLVRFIGQDSEYAMFATPSWSGSPEVYTIWVRKSDWTVRCDCFGSNRWKLVTDILNPEKSRPCKHAREVARIVRRHLGE